MDKIKIKAGDWVVVCDGRKALILENIGDEVYPNLQTKEVREHPQTRTSMQGSDAPGRIHQSVGPARSAVEQTDWHDQEERSFLTALAARLQVALSKGETRALIVVAAPRALGMLREVYSPAVRKAIRAELGKDLVKLPVHEIEKQLLSANSAARGRRTHRRNSASSLM
jgi:protein required for attachment to host cells